jgi:hypothetical protein
MTVAGGKGETSVVEAGAAKAGPVLGLQETRSGTICRALLPFFLWVFEPVLCTNRWLKSVISKPMTTYH